MMGRKRTMQARKIASSGDKPVHPLRLDREVDHDDGVLFHQADEEDDPDDPDHVQVVPGDQEGEERPHAGRRQGGQNGQGMDQALIEHAEDEIDRDQGG